MPSEVISFGPFFRQRRRTQQGTQKTQQGLQIDLLIHRRGHVLTLVECKFHSNPVEKSIIPEVESKVKFLGAPKKFTVEKVLVAANGVTPDLEQEGYFHQIVGLEAVGLG